MTMHLEKALQKVNWSGIFPWVTKEMEIFPQESVLVYASFHGIIYNSNAIPKDKAPKNYEDLIDPALSPTWAGKMAIPAYIHWLIRVSPIWGKEKVFIFARKSRRWPAGACAKAKRSASSAANFRSWRAPAEHWKRCGSGRPKVRPWSACRVRRRRHIPTINCRVPKNCLDPNMAKLFVALIATRDAQGVSGKTRLSKFLSGRGHYHGEICPGEEGRDRKIPRSSTRFFKKKTLRLEGELTKILLK